jgi:hypothetical protein
MKRLLAFTLGFAAMCVSGISTEAKAANSSISPAITHASSGLVQVRRYRRYNRRVRVVTQTRIARVGGRLYRETYQVRYLPNGRTQTRLISRVRIR